MIALSRRMPLSLPGDVVAPRYDVRAIKAGIVHIGVGGFHRSHFARYVHDLMEIDPEALSWGILGSGLREGDIPLLRALERQDGLYTLVECDAEGETKSVIGSILRVIDASASTSDLLKNISRHETKIVSITVSEAGYHLDPATKRLALDSVAIRHDIENPRAPRTMPGRAGRGLSATARPGDVSVHRTLLRQYPAQRPRAARRGSRSCRTDRHRTRIVDRGAPAISEFNGRSHHAGCDTRADRSIFGPNRD
jgi:hypothetical protein